MKNGDKNGTTGFICIMRNMLEYTQLFPTMLAKFSEPVLANSLLPVARKFLDNKNNLTNPWGYDCTYGTALEDDPQLDLFKSWAYSRGKEYLSALGYDSSLLTLNIEIFFSELFEGESHPRHTHPNSKVSGILYLQTPKGSSPLRLHDPRPFRDFVDFPRINRTDYDFIDLEVKQGTGFLWPAWLGHEVLKNQSGDKGRIAIVFNM